MSRRRTRKDESGKPSYITATGYRRLEEEANRLWTVDRPRMTRAVAVAAAEGDRSENAEYIYGKRKLAEIDRRLAHLGKRLDVLTIVDQRPDTTEKVFFGAWVTLEDDDGVQTTYRIVGPDESDGQKRWISLESPMAKALLGRSVDDEVSVPRPKGQADFLICDVRYCEQPQDVPKQ